MKTSTISAGLAILVSVASAAPAATQNQTSQATEKLALIKFEGQIGTFWEAYPYPLTDGDETYTIHNFDDVHTISAVNAYVTCTFKGVKGNTTTVEGPNGSVKVVPPQRQVSASCCLN